MNSFSQAVLVYDVANRASFEELEEWLAEAESFGAGGIPMAVCANKVRHLNCHPKTVALQLILSRQIAHSHEREGEGSKRFNMRDSRYPSFKIRTYCPV